MQTETIQCNGTWQPLTVRYLPELLALLGYDVATSGIAVALNDRVVPRSAWDSALLKPGDRVEVVGAVQGG